MNIAEVQTQLDPVPARITAKGIRNPRVELHVKANEEMQASVYWYGGAGYADFKSKGFRAETPEAAIAALNAWVDGLPSIEETKLRDFMEAVAKAIDLGKETGIEADFVNPLSVLMKTLSENALTYQRTPAE